ncbi:MAG: hypothetical protein Q9208_008174 [Pyrenodesmia sp. 3 TL-2023]
MSDEGEVASDDDESIDAETGRPSKKKKGQKFYCRFGPIGFGHQRVDQEHRLPAVKEVMVEATVGSSVDSTTSTRLFEGVFRRAQYSHINNIFERRKQSRLRIHLRISCFYSLPKRKLLGKHILSREATVSAFGTKSFSVAPDHQLSYTFLPEPPNSFQRIFSFEQQQSVWQPHQFYVFILSPGNCGRSRMAAENLASRHLQQLPSTRNERAELLSGPQPAFAPQAAATPAPLTSQRLPGIETFDQLPNHNASPVRRGGSPMQVDSPSRPPIYPGPSSMSGPNDRSGHASWDMSLHQNLTKLDITNSTPPTDTSFRVKSTSTEQQSAGGVGHDPQVQQTAFQPTPVVVHNDLQRASTKPSTVSQATPIRAKRQGWYNGPLAAPQQNVQQRSPEESSSSEGVPTPSFSTAEYYPSIVNSEGYIEPHHASHPNAFSVPKQAHTYHYPVDANIKSAQNQRNSQDNKMTSLEVLVAVATNEDNARNTNTQPSAA